MIDETRTRFLVAIARQLPAALVIEVHLFAALRQGGMESGVAVIALERDAAPSCDVDGGFFAGESIEERSPYADEHPVTPPIESRERPASRYTVYSARYRYTLKGIDRGKWEVSVTEQADAPLLTVDAVVRGVQRRLGDSDEVLRLSGDEFRAALPAPLVTTTAPLGA